MNKLMLVSGLVAASAFAQVVGPQGAVRPTLNTLNCPKGSRAVSDGEGHFCSKTGAPGGMHDDTVIAQLPQLLGEAQRGRAESAAAMALRQK